MKIGVLGTRGIPAAYGGFETLAEELGARLAARGHDVTVYARPGAVATPVPTHRGVKIVVLPTIRHKYLDTVVHALLSGLHAARVGYDAVLFCNSVNALLCRLPCALGAPTRVVLNVDGLERKRRKWNRLGRLAYAFSERLACVLPHAVVTDAEALELYYRDRYGKTTTFIPYGSELPAPAGCAALDRLGLEPERYVLYVSRLEPENNPEEVLQGYRLFRSDMKLVLVGSAPYSGGLVARLERASAEDPRVVLPGAVYGEGYRELMARAAVYVHATDVGGTHPALVEAMGFGRPLAVHDTSENREVAGEAAVYFTAREPATLARALATLSDPRERIRRGRLAAERARARYRWSDVTDAYERVLAGP